MRFNLSILFIAFTLFASMTSLNLQANEQQIFVVRHVEKLKGKDPELSMAGQKRARALAALMANQPIDMLIATQFKRTQLTLEPLAQAKLLNLTIVAAQRPLSHHVTQTINMAKSSSGSVIIAGHSNTVPMILTALGIKQPIELTESDYGDLFLLNLKDDQLISWKRSHFGDAPTLKQIQNVR